MPARSWPLKGARAPGMPPVDVLWMSLSLVPLSVKLHRAPGCQRCSIHHSYVRKDRCIAICAWLRSRECCQQVPVVGLKACS